MDKLHIHDASAVSRPELRFLEKATFRLSPDEVSLLQKSGFDPFLQHNHAVFSSNGGAGGRGLSFTTRSAAGMAGAGWSKKNLTMKILRPLIIFLLFAAPVMAQTVTLTATHLTVEHGGQIPPLIWTQNIYPTTCRGYPSIGTTATSASAPGTYPVTLTAGTFACARFTMSYVGSNLVVIPNDGNRAQINNSVTYPPGFTSGPATNPAVDVTSNSVCNMVGDGVRDNTICLNSLLSQHMDGSCGARPTFPTYLYFPPGIYLVSNQINPCGNGWTFFGSGPQSSIIRLAPNSAAFNTGTDTQWFNPTSVGGNSNFREFVYNMGFDAGYGNPNAIIVTSEANNVGAFRNVILWSEDGNCPYTFNLSRGFPGPALSKNVAMYGCRNAVYSNQVEYDWTFDQITTEGQTSTVMNTGSLKINVEHWLSDNSGTAVAVKNSGAAVILDSELLNGGGSTTGIIVAPGGSLYARNVKVTGYSPSEVDTGTEIPVTYSGNLTENWTGTAQALWNSGQAPGSLNLPHPETPLPTDDAALANWTKLDLNQSDWCRQIGGSTSATIYAPPGQYTGSGSASCSIPDTVNHINFYNSLNTSQGFQFTFTVAGTSSTPLVIDGCLYAVCSITHTGSRTVVITDTYLKSYQAMPDAGNLFLEDMDESGSAGPTFTFQSSQNVWARGLNLEDKSLTDFICDGCTLWMLGYKTEALPGASPLQMVFTNGARAEVFGSFLYPLGAAGPGTFPIQLKDSSFFAASTFAFVNSNGNMWQYWVQDTKFGANTLLSSPSQSAGNYILSMYYSISNSKPRPEPPTKLSILLLTKLNRQEEH
jgi:hypothetical protein